MMLPVGAPLELLIVPDGGTYKVVWWDGEMLHTGLHHIPEC